MVATLILRPVLFEARSCASYLCGCGTHDLHANGDPERLALELHRSLRRLLEHVPPRPADERETVSANRAGTRAQA